MTAEKLVFFKKCLTIKFHLEKCRNTLIGYYNSKNGIRYEKNGWIYLSVKGTPKECGFANGYLLGKELY